MENEKTTTSDDENSTTRCLYICYSLLIVLGVVLILAFIVYLMLAFVRNFTTRRFNKYVKFLLSTNSCSKLKSGIVTGIPINPASPPIISVVLPTPLCKALKNDQLIEHSIPKRKGIVMTNRNDKGMQRIKVKVEQKQCHTTTMDELVIVEDNRPKEEDSFNRILDRTPQKR